MSNFARAADLTQLGCSRAQLHSLAENLKPTSDLCHSEATLEVASDKLRASGRVPRWVRIQKTHADFQTAGLTNDIEVFSLPPRGIILATSVNHTTAFAGASISDYDISLGISGTAAKYGAARDVDGVTTAAPTVGGSGAESMTTSKSIRAYATAVGANLDQSSAGVIEFYICYAVLPAV